MKWLQVMHKFKTICPLAVILFSASCQLRPLVDPSELVQIKVVVNTDNISNVTCDFYNPSIVYPGITTDMIRCMFYNPDDGDLVSQCFITDKEINENGQEVLSGLVNIYSGCFDIICYNFDIPNTLIKNESILNDVTAYTSKSVKNDKPVYITPDQLVVSRDFEYTIRPRTDLLVIETEAKSCIDTYYIQIGVNNYRGVSSATGVLSGMSPENKFALNERSSDYVNISFDMQLSTDEKKYGKLNNDVLCTIFNTFGKIDFAESVLYLTVKTSSGNTVEKIIAMDKVFATEDANNHHWLIIDDMIEIPDDEPGGGGGFNPGMGDWDEEEGDVIL